MIPQNRKIAILNFYGEGRNIYEDELGWRLSMKKEAGSVVSKEIFTDQIVDVGLNIAFYYIDNDTFYGIHRETYPIECKILPRNRKEKYIGWQCDGDTHHDGKVIASFDDEHDIWDNLKIGGNSLEDVLARSYIIALN